MVKLILSLTLIWTLFSTAEALKCFVGEGSSSSSKNCSDGEICATVATQGDGPDRYSRCVPSSLFRVGNHTLSYNSGDDSVTAAVHVCDKDDCNKQAIPLPGVQKNNNLKCFTCDNKSPPVCNQTLQCVGVQDRCISGTVTSGGKDVFFGCVSANLCKATDRFEFFNGVKYPTPKCCEGNLCNSAWSFKLNVMTLFFGLFTLIFY